MADIDTEALEHLRKILQFLAELAPADRCEALDNASVFYHQQCPETPIEPMTGWVTRMVAIGPGDSPRPQPITHETKPTSVLVRQLLRFAHWFHGW